MKMNSGFRPRSLEMPTYRQMQMIDDYVPDNIISEEPSNMSESEFGPHSNSKDSKIQVNKQGK